MPKERVEVMCGGRAWVLDDFRTLTAYDPGGERPRPPARRTRGTPSSCAGCSRRAAGASGFEPGIDAAYAAQSVALAALDSIATGDAVDVPLPSDGPRLAP